MKFNDNSESINLYVNEVGNKGMSFLMINNLIIAKELS